MASWFGYLKVHSGGEYRLSMSNGQGSICVPEEGKFIPFGTAEVTVNLPAADDEHEYPVNLPVNLSVPGNGDAKAAFSSTGGVLYEMKPEPEPELA